MRFAFFFFSCVVIGAAACGDTVDPASPDTPDAAADAPNDTSFVSARCPNGTYTTAPSGAACDETRVQQQRGLAGNCLGPPIGSFCASLDVSAKVEDESALPAGFVCGSPELGVVTCTWSFDDDASSSHVLSAAALEAACAATVALPAATVVCVTYGD